jgi:hypothetical protein
MGRLVAAGAICEQEAAAALIEEAQRIGLGATECERTVASGISEGWSSRGNSVLVSPSISALTWAERQLRDPVIRGGCRRRAEPGVDYPQAPCGHGRRRGDV